MLNLCTYSFLLVIIFKCWEGATPTPHHFATQTFALIVQLIGSHFIAQLLAPPSPSFLPTARFLFSIHRPSRRLPIQIRTGAQITEN